MKYKVLVVDDSTVLRIMIVSVLKKIGGGITIDQAEDGIEGLKMVNTHQYDLVITDLNMPNMGGLELVIQIRKNPLNKFVKICVLSGEEGQTGETDSRKAGANAFIPKPFDPPKLLTAFKNLLH